METIIKTFNPQLVGEAVRVVIDTKDTGSRKNYLVEEVKGESIVLVDRFGCKLQVTVADFEDKSNSLQMTFLEEDPVTVEKFKNGHVTVINYCGGRYILDHPDQGRGKNFSHQEDKAQDVIGHCPPLMSQNREGTY